MWAPDLMLRWSHSVMVMRRLNAAPPFCLNARLPCTSAESGPCPSGAGYARSRNSAYVSGCLSPSRKDISGGVNAFSRYENGKTKPPLALLKLLKVLDRHPDVLDEVRAQ